MKQRLRLLFHLFLVVLIVLNSTCSFRRPARAAARKSPVFILLTSYNKTLDIGREFYLGAIVSNGAVPKWKSSNSRVASVNTYGLVTAKKNGQAKITAKVSGAEARCTVTVNKTRIQLTPASVSLEHEETCQLRASSSNHSPIEYQSRKPSVASVTETGNIRGEKPGTTYITVTADNTKVSCRVKVKKPVITLSHTKMRLAVDSEATLRARTSSGLEPQWKSSKSSVAVVDDSGRVSAVRPGTARISVKLDGITKYCTVKVTK